MAHLTGRIVPNHGLRQDDPLSPFLFILCSKVLSRIIDREVRRRSLHGICAVNGTQSITHLLFADDLIVFGKADENEVEAIINCIRKYGEWYGQCINLQKSCIYFSKNLPSSEANSIASLVGLKIASTELKYLGLPLLMGRSKRQAFEFVIERVQARLK